MSKLSHRLKVILEAYRLAQRRTEMALRQSCVCIGFARQCISNEIRTRFFEAEHGSVPPPIKVAFVCSYILYSTTLSLTHSFSRLKLKNFLKSVLISLKKGPVLFWKNITQILYIPSHILYDIFQVIYYYLQVISKLFLALSFEKFFFFFFACTGIN
jgi:hypothetical protein